MNSYRNTLRLALSCLGYVFPFLCLLVSFFTFTHINKRHLTTYFLLILIFVITGSFIKNKKWFLIFYLFTSLFFAFISFVFISNWILFNTDITESSVYIVLETNLSESLEFFSSYMSNVILILGFFNFIAVFMGVYFMRKYLKKNSSLLLIKNRYKIILVGFFAYFIYLFKPFFLPYVTISSIVEYHNNRKIINSLEIKENGNFKNVTHKETNENEIYVLVIGESTTRNHMSLYGYHRKTNPILEKQKDLFIFNDVITPISNTIWAIRKSLTMENTDFSKRYNSSIIQLFNSAGFKTYWVSNQKPIGIYETSTKFISKTSNKSIYLNSTESFLDEKLIKPFKKILKEKGEKKFIVLHLMGAHALYKSRYPVSYEIFKDTPITKFKHQKALKKINEYDNAVLYNDFVVNNFIQELKKTNSKSYLLYLSDHGEDVYETLNNAVHSLEIGSKPMHDIPFLIWKSKKYNAESKNFIWDKNRKYSTENLIYTIADLSQIDFTEFNPEKSIVNPKFKEVKRIISNNRIYEDVFKKE
ncbi:sulfatase-like hydrolase/transferase [Polaribacter aestuariivivens]|uniref:sulfatase-like hydrolase/transferase n=1 Tax=Polaribacter aestuariivivens TaxID=2304626 RepID=UPI003F495A85